jgi:hypothetical protein
MILEDFVMLGTTVPEPNKDHRIFVCSAGVSAELGSLVRIYPLARRNIPNRWHVYRVPVERNPRDHRVESWMIKAPRALGEHEDVNSHFHEIGKWKSGEMQQLLAKFTVESIAEANDRRISLAIIHPEAAELHFEQNPDSPDSPQLPLFDDDEDLKPIPQGAKRFLFIPRLRFQDATGEHDLMLRDWGCYNFMRKEGYDYALKNMHAALSLSGSSSLLVGNFNQHRNSWLIISVLNGIRPPQFCSDLFADLTNEGSKT